MGTYFPKDSDRKAPKKWFVFDAEGETVGRLASKIARVLRGKSNPLFTPDQDSGDFVVVVNAKKIRFTGTKWAAKEYHHHTGFIGHLKSEKAGKLHARKPEAVLKNAVRGMLPKNPLGRKQLGKLKVYGGEKHPHQAQKPINA